MILVTDYLRNDIDGVACVYAYSEFLRKKNIDAVGGLFGRPHSESHFVIDMLKIKKLADAEKMIGSCDGIILVDASDTRGISPKIDPEKVVEIIDHRALNEAEKFPNAKVQIELVGSAATLIAEKFFSEKIEMSVESSRFLALAIVSNTVNFMASVTTKRDRAAFKRLNKNAKITKTLIRQMFVHKSKFKSLNGALTDGFASFSFGKNIGIAQLEIVHAEKFARKNLAAINKFLTIIKKKRQLDMAFLTCIDIEKGFNIFVTIDDSQSLLSSLFKIKFSKGIAKRQGVIMRKELTPLIKEALK